MPGSSFLIFWCLPLKHLKELRGTMKELTNGSWGPLVTCGKCHDDVLYYQYYGMYRIFDVCLTFLNLYNAISSIYKLLLRSLLLDLKGFDPAKLIEVSSTSDNLGTSGRMCLFRVIVEDFEEELGVEYTKPVRNQNCSPTSHVFVYFHVRYQCSSLLAQWKKCLRDYKYHNQSKHTKNELKVINPYLPYTIMKMLDSWSCCWILRDSFNANPPPKKNTMRPPCSWWESGERPPPGDTGNLSSHDLLVYGCFQK